MDIQNYKKLMVKLINMIQITIENMSGIQKTKNGFKKTMIACQICGNLTRKGRCECIYFCKEHSDPNKKPITRSQCPSCWKKCPHRNRVWDSTLKHCVVSQKSSAIMDISNLAQASTSAEITEQNWRELDNLRHSDAVQQISQDEIQDNASEMSEGEIQRIDDMFNQPEQCEE